METASAILARPEHCRAQFQRSALDVSHRPAFVQEWIWHSGRDRMLRGVRAVGYLTNDALHQASLQQLLDEPLLHVQHEP